MPDEIIGIAVLDRTESPEMLYVLCKCSDGRELPTHIPVYPKGGHKSFEHQWAYEIKGTRLDVTPSLNWIDVFHNAGAWSVEFQDFDTSQYKYPGDQFRKLNGRQERIDT